MQAKNLQKKKVENRDTAVVFLGQLHKNAVARLGGHTIVEEDGYKRAHAKKQIGRSTSPA